MKQANEKKEKKLQKYDKVLSKAVRATFDRLSYHTCPEPLLALGLMLHVITSVGRLYTFIIRSMAARPTATIRMESTNEFRMAPFRVAGFTCEQLRTTGAGTASKSSHFLTGWPWMDLWTSIFRLVSVARFAWMCRSQPTSLSYIFHMKAESPPTTMHWETVRFEWNQWMVGAEAARTPPCDPFLQRAQPVAY